MLCFFKILPIVKVVPAALHGPGTRRDDHLTILVKDGNLIKLRTRIIIKIEKQ